MAEFEPTLPRESTAVKVTVVEPIGNISGASLVTETLPSVASLAVAPSKNAEIAASLDDVPLASVAATLMSAGTLTEGPVVSLFTDAVTVLVSNEVEPTAEIEILPSARALASTEVVQALSVQSAASAAAVADPAVKVTTTETPVELQVPETS